MRIANLKWKHERSRKRSKPQRQNLRHVSWPYVLLYPYRIVHVVTPFLYRVPDAQPLDRLWGVIVPLTGEMKDNVAVPLWQSWYGLVVMRKNVH